MHFPVVIIGAGPAGLSCARILGQNGIHTLLVEKKQVIGSKVCAGGLTWGGLAGRIPDYLVEKAFPIQHIKTRLQSISLHADHPIIVTVNREKLGRFMLEQATESGVKILPATRVLQIRPNELILRQAKEDHTQKVTFDYLVGADGSHSIVRRYLNLSTKELGVGLNYQVPGEYDTMEWHLNADYFRNGYGWIFPHRTSFSIGAYTDASVMQASTLQKNLICWAKGQGVDLTAVKCRAEFINFDFSGWNFHPVYLAGDAAGLASALTGEGIYPAIVSGETVARKIIDPDSDNSSLERIIKKQRYHKKFVKLTGKHSGINAILCELLVFALRTKVLDFHQLEMAD
jgi:flavin-dependent dehydrogenase